MWSSDDFATVLRRPSMTSRCAVFRRPACHRRPRPDRADPYPARTRCHQHGQTAGALYTSEVQSGIDHSATSSGVKGARGSCHGAFSAQAGQAMPTSFGAGTALLPMTVDAGASGAVYRPAP